MRPVVDFLDAAQKVQVCCANHKVLTDLTDLTGGMNGFQGARVGKFREIRVEVRRPKKRFR